MNGEQATREEMLFDAAIRIRDPAARAAFLDASCRGDQRLRTSVDRLLSHHDTDDHFLDTPLFGRWKEGEGEYIGARIGPYELLQRIGEGGFGVVYRAHQREPVEREVALKILKLGMDTQQIVARFHAEHRALALMNHPNIATVLDAGATQTGRPYFVMELVDGQPVDAYCDQHQLSVPGRLELLATVSRAVQHAHLKGIVHRDLKPSNVLVTDDGSVVPKVIDFGIAKAIDHPNEATDVTDVRQLVGTPEYMSPEQVTRGMDIDPRADVYALGVLLYKLLIGRTPLETKDLKQAGLEEVCCRIRQQVPERPSALLLRRPSDLAEVAAARSATPATLRRSLRCDLDWIAVKALEKDRNRRYESAGQLARDLERYLKKQPVSAGPPSVSYRARKFVQRNRIGVAAAALVLVALSIGASLAIIGYVQADRQRRQAVAETIKAAAVVQLMQELLGTSDPEHGHPAKFTVREQLDKFSDALGKRLSNQPEVESYVRRTIGRSYCSLGDAKRAGPHLRRALNLRRDLHDDDHPLVAESEVDYAWYLDQVSRIREAASICKRALPGLRRAVPNETFIQALFLSAKIHNELGDLDESRRLIEEAWLASRYLHGREHSKSLAIQGRLAVFDFRDRGRPEDERLVRDVMSRLLKAGPGLNADVAQLQRGLAVALLQQGRLAEAEDLSREALKTHRELLGEHSSGVVRDLVLLAKILQGQQKMLDAETAARQAVDIAEKVTVERELVRGRAYRVLAQLIGQRNLEESAKLWAKAIHSRRHILGEHRSIAPLLRQNGKTLYALGRIEDAIRSYEDVITILRDHGQVRETVGALRVLAEMYRDSGDVPLAEQCLQEAIAMSQDDDHRRFLRLDLIEALIELGKLHEAEECVAESEVEARDESDVLAEFFAKTGRARLLMARGEFDVAETILRNAIKLFRGRTHRRAREQAYWALGVCLIESRDFEEAEAVLLRFDRNIRRGAGHDPSDAHRVAKLFIRLYEAWDKPDAANSWRSSVARRP